MRSVDSFNFNGKKALVRVDFNVPIDNNIVTDSSRILAAKNTIDKVCNDGGSCILMSHLGRPNGFQLEYSLSKIVKTVESVLNKKVFFSQDVIGKDAIKKSSELKQGEVLLLENVRFHNEETAGDIDFARDLSKLGDCYINDAFGTAHRAHSSTTVVAGFFKDKFFGKLLEKEVKSIKKVMESA